MLYSGAWQFFNEFIKKAAGGCGMASEFFMIWFDFVSGRDNFSGRLFLDYAGNLFNALSHGNELVLHVFAKALRAFSLAVLSRECGQSP